MKLNSVSFFTGIGFGAVMLLFYLATGLSAVTQSSIFATDDHKVEICHVPPGNPDNPQEIEIDKHAWETGHDPHNSHNLDFLITDDHHCSPDDDDDDEDDEDEDDRHLTPPSFGKCPVPPVAGDRASYLTGTHAVPGYPDLFIGRDDVFSKGNGNYLQCLCSDSGEGIETRWWSLGGLAISDPAVQHFVAQGWMAVADGASWGLNANHYLAKNERFSCRQATPSPTPTVTPSPTPSPTPVPSGTGQAPTPKLVECSDLRTSVREGSVPLHVKFTAISREGDKIKNYDFDFGDDSDSQNRKVTQPTNEFIHTYHKVGSFIASVWVRDVNGNVDGGGGPCRVEIIAKAQPQVVPQVLGISTSATLPDTGSPITWSLLALITIPTSVFLYRKFRLL